jgi:tetratricopeptide (TPR) repeat protein
VPLHASPMDVNTGTMSAFQAPLAEKLDVSKPSSSLSSHQPQLISDSVVAWYQNNLGVPPASAAETNAPAPPTNAEVALLRNAFAAFYGAPRDAEGAEKLLSEAIEAWQRQSADEQAGLYRVRGDCYVALLRPLDAIADYSKALALLDTPDGKNADPAELPASL